MTTFTIDTDNNITAHGTPEEAAATTTTPFDTFASQEELAELVAGWPGERLVAVWNSLPGVTPVKKFKDRTTAATRIWKNIQNLGESVKPKPAEPVQPKVARKAKGGAQAAKGAPASTKATKKATAAKKAPQGKRATKTLEATAPREGSKCGRAVLAQCSIAPAGATPGTPPAPAWRAQLAPLRSTPAAVG
jgi:hypothetical protein